ncbi:MAG: SH3 domain-containing C40 family peptidase [Clostridiales bacterium]
MNSYIKFFSAKISAILAVVICGMVIASIPSEIINNNKVNIEDNNTEDNAIQVVKNSKILFSSNTYKKVYVTASALNIRVNNSTAYRKVGLAYRGESLTSLSYKNGWYKIKKSNGLIGWVSGKYISSKPIMLTSNSNSKQKLIDHAMTYIGTPYVYGGYSRSGVDCSGYVGVVYKTYANVKLNRTASSMSKQGKVVSKSKALPGDLMFFSTGGGKYISHVGIYIGEGKMVHASASKRKVITTSIQSSYWKNTFVTMKRITLP